MTSGAERFDDPHRISRRRESLDEQVRRRGIKPISEIMGADSPDPWAYFQDLEGNVFEIKQRNSAAE